MPILVLQALVTVTVAVHIYRTGRPRYWIFIVMAFPVLGALAYLFMEVLPGSPEAAQVGRGLRTLRRRMDPTADLRKRAEDLERCGSVANRVELARECIDLGCYDQAASLLQSCLSNQFSDDPQIRHLLAVAHLGAGRPHASIELLRALLAADDWFAGGDALLLLANAHAMAGRVEDADAVFRALVPRYPGEEARADYIGFLAGRGRIDEAKALWQDMQRRLRLNGRSYRQRQRPFVGAAEAALRDAGQELG